jgi:Ca2+-binding RTX toxin-like protein
MMPLIALAAIAAFAAPAQAAKLSSVGGTIHYVAGQGENNDVRVNVKLTLGVTVYTFTDHDAPIEIGVGNCDLINGVGMCATFGVRALHVNARDKDDTIKIAVAGEEGLTAPRIPTVLIGGRGEDVLIGGNGRDKLKGNNGRDTLRGRKGKDVHKGGRGSDTLQTLDGQGDLVVNCGEGRRDLVRADPQDPEPRRCELGGRKVSKPF